ncbi:MAG: hypothetical protein HY070_08115 [Chloroflexi bacterium]|nr:hypothetical protein [Chloroflexota bacterium]
MASSVTRKKLRKQATRIGNMTRDELRAMIEQLINRKLSASTSSPTRRAHREITPEMRRRAMKAVGQFRAGHAEVSSEHDDYLATDYTA